MKTIEKEDIISSDIEGVRYCHMIDLLSSDKEASKMYLDMCKSMSTVNDIIVCSDDLRRDLLTATVKLEDNYDKVNGLITSIECNLKYLYKIKAALDESNTVIKGIKENILSLEGSLFDSIDNT